MAEKGVCSLCGEALPDEPLRQRVGAETKLFCSAGCRRAYGDVHSEPAKSEVAALSGKRRALGQLFLNTEQTAYFSVQGMYCAGCAATAENILRRQQGVSQVEVNFAGERGRIEYDPEQTDLAAALRKLERLGYQAQLLSDDKQQQAELRQERTLLQLLTAAAFGMQVMVIYLVQLYPLYAAQQFDSPTVRGLQYLVWALATPILFVGGWSILQGAWRATLAATATMDTLVAVGTGAAYSYSVYITLVGGGEVYFDSVAMIVTFIMLGRYLERIGGAQARKDIRHLLQLQPTDAWRRAGGEWQKTAAALLAPGDQILIKPGERVPADARIVEGEAALDEALLTGEATPVNKGPGAEIFAGAIVSDEALVAEVVRPLADGRLAQITRIVEQTLNVKPPIQRLADRAAAYFAFAIFACALLTFLGWWLTGAGVAQALLAAVAVLVVACPCALGLATPLALAVALGRTSRAGVLVRNAVALETASTVQRVVFDKTGTLTRGRLSVTAAVTVAQPPLEQSMAEQAMAPEELLCLAAAVEQYSEHPLAKAILRACPHTPAPAGQFKVTRGLGAGATVGAQQVKAGSARFLAIDAECPLFSQAQAHSARGETVVWVSVDANVAGFIALRDEPDAQAAATLRQLAAEGITAVLLSGDNPHTTAAIAQELGLAEHAGDASPQDKAERIRQWQAQGLRVAMVGDGVNDAPALAQADLSITVAGGTDVAGESSDVVLTQRDLTLVPWFIALARRTRRTIVQNLGWAFAYNLLAVPLAAFGLISPIIAAAAMATSSLLVVGNSLRLRR